MTWRTTGTFVVSVAGIVGGCGSQAAEQPDTAAPLPPGFGGLALRNGIELDPVGAGVQAATLWAYDTHPGTAVGHPGLSDEQFVPQPVPTEAGDAAIGIRGGAFCYLTPTIRSELDGSTAEVSIESLSDDELAALAIPCPAAEELIVISFELDDTVTELRVDGIDVPLGSS